jgi:hypothetical protein
LILAGLSSALVVARVLAISGYDTTTALALLSGGAGPTLVIGTVVGVLPFAVLFVAVVAWMLRSDVPAGTDQRLLLNILLGFAVFVTMAFVPAVFAIVALLIAVSYPFWRDPDRGGLHKSQRGSHDREQVEAHYVRRATDPVPRLLVDAVVLISPLIFWMLAPMNVWLAPERITRSDDSVVVGYVTATTSRWTQVLHDERRIVLTLLSDDIDARTYCQPRNHVWSATTVEVAMRLFGYVGPIPECSTA